MEFKKTTKVVLNRDEKNSVLIVRDIVNGILKEVNAEQLKESYIDTRWKDFCAEEVRDIVEFLHCLATEDCDIMTD